MKPISNSTTNTNSVNSSQNCKLEKQEYEKKIIELFKELDTNGDKVLNSEDTLVKTLEDILQGKINDQYSYSEMAKYVILRNMSKGKEISLENISNRFEEVWSLCQNDDNSQQLMKKIDDLFQEYSIGIEKINSEAKRANEDLANYDSKTIEEIRINYTNYCNKLKDKGIEPDISFEEFKNHFLSEFNHINNKLKETEKIRNNCVNLKNKITVDTNFLNNFGTYFNDLQIRIQVLELKKEREQIETSSTNNQNPKTKSTTKNKGPHFGF